MGHQTRRISSSTGRRLMVSDNFYTRHLLARALLKFTDGEARLLGTVRLNLVDKWNRKELTAAVARVSEIERSSWELVAAVDVEPGLAANIQRHNQRQRRIPKAKRTVYTPTVTISPFAGYIVFKDKQAVIFYTNDLKCTPPTSVLNCNDPRAIACVHGLYPIRRWTGSEIMHRTTFMVPTLVAAYNLAMNAVDRVDQLRSTNPTRRKEMRLSMSMLTWALELCALNAFALLRKVHPTGAASVSVREFKRRLAEALTAPALQQRQHGEGVSKRKRVQSLVSVVGNIGSRHILTPNSTTKSSGQLKCLLCSMQGLQRRSRWGCASCERGFHVECFAAFHFRDVFLAAATPSVREALDHVCAAAAGNQPFCVRTKHNNSITPVSNIILPQ
ncbi:hypothetical protein PPTG_20034 [Phytophthora nicotianae INRA-310]|uniref:PiggyBac transposable element-derived protein domain-containing protein n=1 Tax=Phytophthora nicotianae (strain INRA-310) TaxID=761204 RepID=W2PAB6_PHYN3|nr:hypothetical protein PPTG_20034 [Phytophthora nicotianae INRA-310]ETM97605.1 hypothetical protein PPTG_20034 [Phytophthora nicotianae INRA-310]